MIKLILAAVVTLSIFASPALAWPPQPFFVGGIEQPPDPCDLW